MFCRLRDIAVWKSAGMASAQSWSRRHHLLEPTSSIDFQRVIYLYIQNISTCLSSKAQRRLRTIFIQKSKLKYAYLPSKIVAVWIDRLGVRYDRPSRRHQCPQCANLFFRAYISQTCHQVWIHVCSYFAGKFPLDSQETYLTTSRNV